MIDETMRPSLRQVLDQAAWSVPDGWTPDRVGRCKECGETVLWAKVGSRCRGTILRFNRDASEHGRTCDGRKRRR